MIMTPKVSMNRARHLRRGFPEFPFVNRLRELQKECQKVKQSKMKTRTTRT